MTVPNLARFQDAQGQWLESDKWPHNVYVATCRTQGCIMQNISSTTTVYDNVDGVLRVICGHCSQYINDIHLKTFTPLSVKPTQ